MPFQRLLASLRGLMSKRDDGSLGERIACRFLKQQGYRIIARNLRSAAGEIDALALTPDGRTLVVVEVKTSRSASGPMPEVHVNRAKQRQLVKLAADAARRYRLTDRAIRFDVVGVTLEGIDGPDVRHHVAAFESHI